METVQVKTRAWCATPSEAKAILYGAKAQLRVAVQADYDYKPDGPRNGKYYMRRPDMVWNSYETVADLAAAMCPLGKPGDRLWVKEAYRCSKVECPVYRADYPEPEAKKLRWKSGVIMPRVASRIMLEIIAVRVERLINISTADAIAEGIEPVLCPTTGTVPAQKWKNYLGRAYQDGMNLNYATESYLSLWNSLHGADAHLENPWVWVVEFKVLSPAL